MESHRARRDHRRQIAPHEAPAPGVRMVHLHPTSQNASSAKGATLIELAIGLTIFSLLLFMAAPHYRDWIADSRLRNQSEALAWSLTRARSEAMRTGFRATLCKSPDRRSCTDTGGWDQGWLLFIDDNRNAVHDDDELTLYVEGPAQHAITITGNRPVADYVSYTSVGHARLLNGGLQMGTFVACLPGRNAVKVVLAHSGRVRIERTPDRCP
jgi:type IV fimbrial biogenesis protein FimT